MEEVKTNKILDGITLTLRKAFPDSFIESRAVDQGLMPPAFLVFLVTSEQVTLANRRYKKLSRFEICYFPKEGNEECYGVADQLQNILEVITLPGEIKARGVDMNHQTIDGVLHFFVSYNRTVYKERDETKMGDLTVLQKG